MTASRCVLTTGRRSSAGIQTTSGASRTSVLPLLASSFMRPSSSVCRTLSVAAIHAFPGRAARSFSAVDASLQWQNQEK
ncbi:hypothetical protein K523DRAFT_249742 [Schizophyllum commune Tattone D]|nr:hypothetical protein K523DRAFT_249742 [Schizophyllum commune Tattone D]